MIEENDNGNTLRNDNRIEEDDIVQVNIENNSMTLILEGKVLHVPTATGDSWIFKKLDDDRIIYISEGCTIYLLEKK